MKKKILVVDDEMDIRIFISTLLETNGYKPIVAKDGEEGLKMVQENKPDCVILDVMMPKESGLKLYREIKSNESHQTYPGHHVFGGVQKDFFSFAQRAGPLPWRFHPSTRSLY